MCGDWMDKIGYGRVSGRVDPRDVAWLPSDFGRTDGRISLKAHDPWDEFLGQLERRSFCSCCLILLLFFRRK